MDQPVRNMSLQALSRRTRIRIGLGAWFIVRAMIVLGVMGLGGNVRSEEVSAREVATQSKQEPVALGEAIDTIRAVGLSGQGQLAARHAWRQLAQCDTSRMVDILAGMQGANRQACNWLRMAVDAIGQRTLQQSQKLPEPALEKFVLDVRQASPARQVAFQWLTQSDPQAPGRLLPGMLDDPCLELRRAAVQQLIAAASHAGKQAAMARGEAAATAKATAQRLYQEALDAARDLDQVEEIAQALGQLDVTVDLVHQLGYRVDWQVIGPFDNTAHRGFDRVYPPEEAIDLDGHYTGKSGSVAWQSLQGDGQSGWVDLNLIFGKLKGTVAYVLTEFQSNSDQEVELRWSTPNATKLWVNGQQVATYESYHTVTSDDQYRATVHLRRGVNHFLMKVCQDEQTESWTVDWQFRFRVTDRLGGAIHTP